MTSKKSIRATIQKDTALLDVYIIPSNKIPTKPTRRGPSAGVLNDLSRLDESCFQPVSPSDVRTTALTGDFVLDSRVFAIKVDQSLVPNADSADTCRSQAHPRAVDGIGSIQRPDAQGFFYNDTSQHWSPGYGRRKNPSDITFSKYNWRPKTVDPALHVLLGQKRVRQLYQVVDGVGKPLGVDAFVYVLESGPLANRFWFLQFYRNAGTLALNKLISLAPGNSERAPTSKEAVASVPPVMSAPVGFFTMAATQPNAPFVPQPEPDNEELGHTFPAFTFTVSNEEKVLSDTARAILAIAGSDADPAFDKRLLEDSGGVRGRLQPGKKRAVSAAVNVPGSAYSGLDLFPGLGPARSPDPPSSLATTGFFAAAALGRTGSTSVDEDSEESGAQASVAPSGQWFASQGLAASGRVAGTGSGLVVSGQLRATSTSPPERGLERSGLEQLFLSLSLGELGMMMDN